MIMAFGSNFAIILEKSDLFGTAVISKIVFGGKVVMWINWMIIVMLLLSNNSVDTHKKFALIIFVITSIMIIGSHDHGPIFFKVCTSIMSCILTISGAACFAMLSYTNFVIDEIPMDQIDGRD